MILERMMQGDPTSVNFADSMSFNFDVDDLPLDTPTVLGELAMADGVLNTPVNRDVKAFNFIKPDFDVTSFQQMKVPLSGEFLLGCLQCTDGAIVHKCR